MTHDRRRMLLIAALVAVLVIDVVVLALAVGSRAPNAQAGSSRGTGSDLTGKVPVARREQSDSPSASKIGAYRGLGSWVDIYDSRAWRDPNAAVADMASHGVKTLYVETGNSTSSFDIKSPQAQAEFIETAHARGMSVVAWYLPTLTNVGRDMSRIGKAIDFTTASGQHFDSFALDIEASTIDSVSARNRALRALTARIRDKVGPGYALGAIIPSPVGLDKKRGYWDAFPYSDVAASYDVILPMAYYTYHGKTTESAFTDAAANLRILRAQPGCAAVPVHMIGGIAEDSSAAQVNAFVGAVHSSDCVGASLYGWAGTTRAQWRELAVLNR
jgi:hypothetical protein